MFALGKDPAFVTHYIRNLRGGSQPILAQASDGFLYVVKFANNLQGPNLLFNEGTGSDLYRACGLLVPEWRPLQVSDSFIDKNPSCWIQTPQGRLRPASGLCFGSRFLGEGGRHIYEILPGSSFSRIRNKSSFWLAWLIDVCAEHVDNRQVIFVEAADGFLDAFFIDQGHIFGGPRADERRHFGASRYLDQRVYEGVTAEVLLSFQNVFQALNSDKLWERIDAIPSEWCHPSGKEGFERCLQRLSTPSLVQHIVEAIIGDLEQRTQNESAIFRNEWRLLSEVLRTGLQGAGFGWGYARDLNCA